MSQLSDTNQLSLNRWFSYQQGMVSLLNQAPSQEQGLFTIAFGMQLTLEHSAAIAQFMLANNQQVAAICRYQPDPEIPAALCFYTEQATPLNPLLLQDFATQFGFQLAQITTPPNLYTPGLLVMDMDSTAITIECIDEIARLANVYDEVASVTAQAMAGKLDFSESLYQRVSKLAGIEQSLIEELKANLPLMPGIQALCRVLKQHQWYLAIASGGFVPFAEQVKTLLDLDEVHANELEFADHKLTGKVLGTVVDAQQKARVLTALQNKLQLAQTQTIAIGDGANDLRMMAVAGLGVAVHGKPKVVEQAQAAISEGSLLQLLYFLTIPLK